MLFWNNPSQGSIETVSKFNKAQQQTDPWMSRSPEALIAVDDDDCALCAVAASQIYYGESSFFDIMEDALGQKGLTILRKAFFNGKLDEDHTEETHPPMGSIIFQNPESSEATLLLVFRGSTTGYDWTANFDFPPIPSRIWHNEWPHIKVHKGWDGEIWRYFSEYCGIGEDGSSIRQRVDGGDHVPDLLKAYNVTKILFSGHSLGGALAQIASMGGLLMVRKMRERDHEIAELQMRTFTFAAPMPVYFKDEELNDEERQALIEIRRTSFNVVFDLDVVPHIPGHHEWIGRMSTDMTSDLSELAVNAVLGSRLPETARSYVKGYVQPYMEKIAQTSSEKAEHFKEYKHISKIVHFDLNNAESLAGFTAFSIKIMTPEEYGQLEYPFPASKNRRFKVLLGLLAHSCVPETIVSGSFNGFRSMSQEINNESSTDVKDGEGEIKDDYNAEQVNNDNDKKRIEPEASSDSSLVVADVMSACKSLDPHETSFRCSDSFILPDSTNYLEDSFGLSDDPCEPGATVYVDRRLWWTATSSPWAAGLFVIFLLVISSWNLLKKSRNARKEKKVSQVAEPAATNVLEAPELSCAATRAAAPAPQAPSVKTLLIIGGYDGSSCFGSVEEYNIAKGASFVPLKSSMQQKRNGHCGAVIDGQVYVSGGENGKSILSSVERYDPAVGKWSLLRVKMNTPRDYCAAAAVDGRLYVIGGYDDKYNHLNSVEMFDTKTELWSTVARMGSKRCQCAAVSLGEKIYVFGGRNGLDRLNTGEVYDPKKDEWTPLPTNMSSKRLRCAAAVLGDKVFVAGGWDGSSTLNSVEVYDPAAGTWSYLSKPMHTKRYGCAAAVMGGKLHVVGGFNWSDGLLDSVEVYNPTTEWWTVMKMRRKRSGCAAIIV